MSRKEELEYQLRIERKNYKVAARKYRNHLRMGCPTLAGDYLPHIQHTQQRIDAILDQIEDLPENVEGPAPYGAPVRAVNGIWWEESTKPCTEDKKES